MKKNKIRNPSVGQTEGHGLVATNQLTVTGGLNTELDLKTDGNLQLNLNTNENLETEQQVGVGLTPKTIDENVKIGGGVGFHANQPSVNIDHPNVEVRGGNDGNVGVNFGIGGQGVNKYY